MSNVLKYQRAETTRKVSSSNANYQAALDLSLLFSTEVELQALLERILQTATTLLPTCSGLEFRQATQQSNIDCAATLFGSKAHHSISFQLSHRESPVGELTIYNRKRTLDTELESIEDLVSIVIQPLHVALRLQQANRDADNNRLLQSRIEQQLTRHESRQALLLSRLDPGETGEDGKRARARVMETLSDWQEEPWLEVCDEHTLVTLVRIEKANWAAERVRILVAAASESLPGNRGPTVTITIANLRNPGEAGKLLHKSIKVLNHPGSGRGNQIVKIA